MKSHNISNELKNSLERNNMEQQQLARGIYKGKTTVNGYFKGTGNAPMDVMADIADTMKDDMLNQDFSNILFDQIPSMNSDILNDCPMAFYFIHRKEVAERDLYRDEALQAMATQKEYLNDSQKDIIWNYAMNKLDVIFVELRQAIAVFKLIDLSLARAIKLRKPHWKHLKYIKE